MKKEGMKKKGQAKILVIILIMIMIFILIIVLWNLLFPILKIKSEVTGLKAELVRTKISLDDIEGDYISPDKINITLSRRSDKMVLESETEIVIPVSFDIVSVVDLSGSMGDGWFGLCDADYSAGGCCDREDCSIESGCNNCNGKLNDGKCELYSKFYDECCYEDGTDCSIMDDCESCDGVRRYPDWIADRNCWKSYPASEYIYWPCFSSKEDCEEDCGGLWTSKFDLARDANIDFINTVFDNNGDHKIGLVGYEGGPILDDGDSSTEDCSDCHDLVDSSGKNNLINFINAEWNPLSGSTCICCGFEKAIEYLEDSERFKSVILMTDGLPGSMTCEGLSDRDALKTFTERSFEEDGIRVYTIGFGDDVDDSLLQEVADLGGGEYFSSEASSELTDIYDRAITEIIRNYRAENNWDHLKIVFYNSTTSWIYRHYDVPLPLETIKYEIPSLGGLKESITNLTYVEAYMASYTESGVEVLSPLLGRAKF